MENKKKLILIVIIVLILILTVVVIVGKLTKSTSQTAQTKVATQEKPTITAKNENENLPTFEMGNAIGEVQSITSDSLIVKTDDGKTLTLAIKGAFNVLAFIEKGVEQKKISDVKTGSKVSVQYSKDNVVMSMYLMK